MKRLRRPPLRWRVTATFTLAAAVVLAVLGVFLHVRLTGQINNTVESALRQRLSDVTTLLRGNPVQGFARLEQSGGNRSADDVTQLLTAGGTVLASERIGNEPLLSAPQLAAARAGTGDVIDRQSSGPGGKLALLAGPVGTRVVVVGTELDHYDRAVSDLDELLLLGLPAALVLAALAGYYASGLALAPVDRMRERADLVGVGNFDDRLPEPDTDDELQRLARTLNSMLDRLQAGYARERAFVDDAAHELRTPLTLLRGELELSAMGKRTPEELQATIATARVQTERLVALANDVLVLARSADGQLPLRVEPLPVAELLEAAAARGRAWRSDRDVVVQERVAAAGTLAADRLRIEQALDNLMINALEHGAGQVTLDATREGHSVVLSVQDQGATLDPAVAQRAFDRFARGDAARAGTGTGLGLAIVKTIAEAHAGTAGLEPIAGGGTRAWLRLPTA